MRRRGNYSIVNLCVCLCVTMLAAIYLVYKPQLRVIGLFVAFKDLYHVSFTEYCHFSSSGVFCLQQLPPSTLPDKLSMHRMISSGFYSRQKGCNFSNSSYITITQSLSHHRHCC